MNAPPADHGRRARQLVARLALRLLAAWLVAVAPPAAPAAAQTPLADERVTVRVDGRPLFRVGPADTTAAEARARRIERRLTTLLETPAALTPARVERAGPAGADRAVTVAGVPVVTVTPTDAEDNLTTADALAAQWARAVDAELGLAASRRLSPGARFVAEVRGSVTAAFSRLLESAIRIVPRGLAAALVLLLFWGIAAAVRRVLHLAFERVIDDPTFENLVRQVAYYAVWALGLVLAVSALGFEPETVVTGLGLTSLALGFALKDVLSNFVAGVLLLAQRPFRIGDQIVVGDVEGSVERIRLRATSIRTYDGRLVLVPNAELFGSRVTNNTESPRRRAAVPFFVGYDADLRHAAAVALDAVRATAGVLDEPPPAVRVAELGQNDAVLEARFWTDSRRSDFTATQALVREAVVAAFRAAGIGLPDPGVRHLVPRDPARWRTALGVEARDGVVPDA